MDDIRTAGRGIMPKQATEPYGYYVATREGLFRALIKPKGSKPPAGWIYWDFEDNEAKKEKK